MDLLDTLEIYIPPEAEVKSIPLWSLPNSVLRRMGLPPTDCQGSRKLADSPEGIWICPAVLQRKGQRMASHTGNSVIESMSSPMGRQFRATPGPFRMSFVSSNNAAYRVLKDTMPGKKVSSSTSHTSLLTPGSASHTCHDAVVIYRGRIYLSIRKTGRGQRHQEEREPQPAIQSVSPSTSDVSSKGHRKSPQASLQPADKGQQKKRLRIPLPQSSSKQKKDLNESTTERELLSDNRPKKKHDTYKASRREIRNVAHKGGDVSSSMTARSVSQSTEHVHKVGSHCRDDAGGEQAAEEAAGQDSDWFQPLEEQEEAGSTSQDDDVDSGGPGGGGGLVEESSSLSRGSSTSLQQDYDFQELEREESIARMRAKLKQNEAALNNLH